MSSTMLAYLLVLLAIVAVAKGDVKKGPVKISWKVENDKIVFESTMNTKGWTGIGFSKDGSMEDADMAIAGVKADGSSYILNRFGLEPVGEHYCPAANKKPHWQLLEAKEDGGKTTVKLVRPLDPGHPQSYKLEKGKKAHLIYAWHADQDFINDCESYHGPKNRASEVIDIV